MFIVFLVFSISGSLSVFISEPFLKILKYEQYITNEFIKVVLRILIIFPLYQFILIIVGSLFGEFNYFWNFQKRFIKKFKKK